MKNTPVLYMFILIMVLSMIAGCTPAAATEAPQAPTESASEKPVLKVATGIGIPGYMYEENGEVKGYEYEMLVQTVERMGYELDLMDVDFSGIFAGLQSGKWDLACSTIYITKERSEQMDFTEPYDEGYDVAVSKKDSGISELADIKDKIVGSETGTSSAAWVAGLQQQFGPFEERGYDSSAAAALDMQSGRIDALFAGRSEAQEFVKNNPEFDIFARNEDRFLSGCAVRKDDPIKAKFDEALQALKEEGVTAKLYEKYFGFVPPPEDAAVKVFTEPYVPEN